MGKARSGTGSIKKRKAGKLAGKWRLQWGYEDPITKEYTPVDKTFVTEGEAQSYFDDLKAKVKTGQLIATANTKKALTLNAWFDELAGTKENQYMGRWKEDGMKTQTIAVKISRYNQHVRKSTLGTTAIKNIGVDQVRAFYRTMKTLRRSPATIADVKGVLVKVVNDAIDTYEKLPNLRNVFEKVKVDSPSRRNAVALTVKQAKKALARQTTASDRAMLGLFLLGGLRLSELMALHKAQIDLRKGVIVIDRSVKLSPTGEQTIGLPKNDKVRMVTICPTLAELLKPLCDGDTGYLFSAATQDQPRAKKLVYATWQSIKSKGKLPATMVIKDCRLSHNNWIEKLMPRVSLSTRLEHMGHSTRQRDKDNKGIAVNLTNYTRFLSQAQEILREELERVLSLKDRPMRQLQD